MIKFYKAAIFATAIYGVIFSGNAFAATEQQAAARAAEIQAMPPEQQAILAKEMSDFSELYYPHVTERDNRRSRRGAFTGNLKFRESSCIMGTIGSFGTLNKDSDGKPLECDCPRGTRKLSCLKSASATVRFANADAGSIGYVLIYANDGKQDTAFLLNGDWEDIRSFKSGRYSFRTYPVNGVHTYQIPYERALCGNGGGMVMGIAPKTYTIYAGYGVADKMDVKYMDLADKNGIPIDRDDFLWQAARMDGYRTKNTLPIGSITCN